MALVRHGGKTYFYRHVRCGGTVRRMYMGSGPLAEMDQECLDARRHAAAARRLAVRAKLARVERRGRALARRLVRVDALVRLTLELSGFHRPKGWLWRRRRDRMNDPMPEVPAPADVPGTLREKLRLIQRASRGDKNALPAVRSLLEQEPGTFLRACKAELAEVAERIMAGLLSEDSNLAFRAGIGHKLELLRAELAGPDPSTVERLLAERAALCWLDAHCCDIRHAALSEAKGVPSLRLQDAYDRMRDQAHRRYLQALKALAQVRKLALPTVQVNVARHQVNVAGTVTPPGGLSNNTTGMLPA